MSYNIIITSGGTTEKIDDVRKITNTSTGKLGSLIAYAFYDKIPDSQIIYICSYNAIIPDIPGMRIIKINNVSELKKSMEDILITEKIAAVIHAMAVSDYSLRNVTTAEQLSENIVRELISKSKLMLEEAKNLSDLDYKKNLTDTVLQGIIGMDTDIKENKKISSSHENLIITMNKTPKIISMIKNLQPLTILVGFKLLNQVSHEQLIETGISLLTKNNCDYVLANDLTSIEMNNHVGYLINKDTTYETYKTKEEIADGIAVSVIQKLIQNV